MPNTRRCLSIDSNPLTDDEIMALIDSLQRAFRDKFDAIVTVEPFVAKNARYNSLSCTANRNPN